MRKPLKWGERMKVQWTLIVALLFSLIVAVFALVNNELVVVNFLFSTVEISLVLLILGSAAAGAVIMVFLSLVRHVQVGFQMRDLKKKVTVLEEDLKAREELSAREAGARAEEIAPCGEETQGAGEEAPGEGGKTDSRSEVDLQERK